MSECYLLADACSFACLDDVRPPRILRAYAGNGDGISESLDELVLQGVDLLEVGVEVRHGVVIAVQIRPNSIFSS